MLLRGCFAAGQQKCKGFVRSMMPVAVVGELCFWAAHQLKTLQLWEIISLDYG